MAVPTNGIVIIATDALGADGFTNKEFPDSPILDKGFSLQSFAYQHANYLHNNHGDWLRYINEEQVPAVATDVTTLENRNINTTSPLTGGGNLTSDLTLAINDATTLQKGAVQLIDSVTSTSILLAPTAKAVKLAKDTADTAQSDIDTHEGLSNPHTDSQATSDLVFTSGTLADGATVPIPAGFALGDCHITITQPSTIPPAWDIDENAARVHYQTECKLVGGVVVSSVTTNNGTTAVRTPVNVAYVLIGRKGTF